VPAILGLSGFFIRIKLEENQMRSLYEPAANHQVVHGRMKDSFTPMYQTLLSIIQGVALADLVTSVAARYQQLTILHWLMILTTFVVLIVVFQVFWIQSAVWGWIPDVRDAAIPFVFGALELFLNHTIYLSMGLWFLGLAGISSLGALGTVHMVWRARGENENAQLLNLLKGYHQLFLLYYTGAAVVSLMFAYICFSANLQASYGVQGVRGLLALGLVLLIAISLVASSLLSNRYWRKALVYARTGNITQHKKKRRASLQK
jgi:hypothetical protein